MDYTHETLRELADQDLWPTEYVPDQLRAHADAWTEDIEQDRQLRGILSNQLASLRKRLEEAASGRTGEWQRCPVCDGRGDHMRGFYDGPGPTSTDCTTRVVCKTCRGIGIICRPAALAPDAPKEET